MANEVRLIDYNAAIDHYYAEYGKQDICCGGQDRDWLKKCFDEAPTIDPESLRPKGRWEQVKSWATKAKYRCSICGREIMSATKVNIEKYPYCHCGAKMEG